MHSDPTWACACASHSRLHEVLIWLVVLLPVTMLTALLSLDYNHSRVTKLLLLGRSGEQLTVRHGAGPLNYVL